MKERQEIEANVEGAVRGMEAMHSIRESIGPSFPEQGIERADHYEEALDALQQMKDQNLQAMSRRERYGGRSGLLEPEGPPRMLAYSDTRPLCWNSSSHKRT